MNKNNSVIQVCFLFCIFLKRVGPLLNFEESGATDRLFKLFLTVFYMYKTSIN